MTAEYFKEQEKAEKEYRRREYIFHMRAIESGKKEGKCKKCGGLGCLPCLYGIPMEREIDGKKYRWRKWVYAVKNCECISRRVYIKEESANIDEMREVFG